MVIWLLSIANLGAVKLTLMSALARVMVSAIYAQVWIQDVIFDLETEKGGMTEHSAVQLEYSASCNFRIVPVCKTQKF